MRAYAKEHVGLTRAVFELYRGVFSCFVVMQASALSVGQRLLFIAETKEQCNKKGGSHYDPKQQTILDKGIMPSEKVLDFPVDCNTLTGSVNL